MFLCKGNLCRSPFAEALAHSSGLFDRVASAGHLEKGGRRPPPEAVRAASAWGVDLSLRRSQKLNARMLDSADVVLVFDLENLERLRERFPRQARKAHLLGLLADGGPLELADPWGLGEQAFELCYSQIDQALGAIRRLRREASSGSVASSQTTAPAS